MDIDDENLQYRVVVNHEEQYSIWPAGRDNPPGWLDGGADGDGGVTGTKAECLEWIERHWSDMRPLSLRQSLDVVHPS
jgi:MbtH protein